MNASPQNLMSDASCFGMKNKKIVRSTRTRKRSRTTDSCSTMNRCSTERTCLVVLVTTALVAASTVHAFSPDSVPSFPSAGAALSHQRVGSSVLQHRRLCNVSNLVTQFRQFQISDVGSVGGISCSLKVKGARRCRMRWHSRQRLGHLAAFTRLRNFNFAASYDSASRGLTVAKVDSLGVSTQIQDIHA